ncbi:MAG: class II aldolase/adducin family protein [Clostridia bacterium]|nr:class II aldolase/adducin family protein [Clostridia bacterium]
MDINTAKQLVIDAGLNLVKCGLIARTWGNVSCRIDENSFVITPSGIAYENLTPEKIVLVNIADCSYEGDVKPSSEKKVHASVYAMRPDANFVIHTHQTYASAVGAVGCDINYMTDEGAEIIGPGVTVAAYGLPGTKRLNNGVRAALERCPSKAIILSHHGAVCFGADYDEAFRVAAQLELESEHFIKHRFVTLTGAIAEHFNDIVDYFASHAGGAEKTSPAFEHFDSTREGTTAVLVSKEDGRVIRVNLKSREVRTETTRAGADYTFSVDLHKAVYNKRKDVQCILHSEDEDIVTMSKAKKVIKPYLDDFAQLVGISMRTVDFNTGNVVKSAKQVAAGLGKRGAVMLKDNGALCVAADAYDAEAVEMVVKKNVKAVASTGSFQHTRPINVFESALMHAVYKLKYSKNRDK